MDSKVEKIQKSLRYRLIIRNGEYYILDIERGVWAIFLPFLVWILPQKMYQVEKEKIENLDRTILKPQSEYSHIQWFSVGMALLLAPLVDPLFSAILPTPSWINLALMILYTVILLFLRLFNYYQRDNLSWADIDLNDYEAIKVRIWPVYFKQFYFPILGTLMTGLFTVGAVSMIIDENVFAGLYVYFLFLPISLLLQAFFVSTDLGKTNTYKVKILNRNT